ATQVAQGQLRTPRRDVRARDVPEDLVETHATAVQRVRAVIRGENVGHAVERKSSTSDAIAVAADQGAKIRTVLEVARERVVAQYDVLITAGAVGGGEKGHDAPVGRHFRLHSVAIAQRVQPHRTATGCCAKGRAGDGAVRGLLRHRDLRYCVYAERQR